MRRFSLPQILCGCLTPLILASTALAGDKIERRESKSPQTASYVVLSNGQEIEAARVMCSAITGELDFLAYARAGDPNAYVIEYGTSHYLVKTQDADSKDTGVNRLPQDADFRAFCDPQTKRPSTDKASYRKILNNAKKIFGLR